MGAALTGRAAGFASFPANDAGTGMALAQLTAEVQRLGDAVVARAGAELPRLRAELVALEAGLAARLATLEQDQADGLGALRAAIAATADQLSDAIHAAEARANAVDARLDALAEQIAVGDAQVLEAVAAQLGAERARADQLMRDFGRDVAASMAAQSDGVAAALRETRRQARMTAAATALSVLAAVAAGLAIVGALAELRPPRSAEGVTRVRVHLPLRPTLPFDALAPVPPDALAPRVPTRPSPNLERPAPAPQPSLSALAAALGRGDAQALARVTALAQGGSAPAQMLLAKVYETGLGGVAKDLAEARRWTASAAQAGERAAMYNLAVYLIEGQGGPRDAPGAIGWFRKAAEAGLTDAQYNLALLYEDGRLVPKNLGEAYRWFSIAAESGDGLARAKAVALEARLPAAERAAADRAVRDFDPAKAGATTLTPVIAPAATVTDTQRMLAREGYYIGATDGRDGEAYRQALAAYLRDHPQAPAS